MRWDNLSAPPDEGVPGRAAPATPPLPLALPGAVVRTFDTPGFAGMTFYEVRAKSIINKVPGASRVPFEWTINPYRGCSHACVYCVSGDTPVLLADGRTKAIQDLEIGERIYGTQRRGAHRRYVVTTVLAKWSTVKPAHRVTLDDGTTLVASGDHRFLSREGWRYVSPEPGRRKRLTSGERLVGTGRFPEGHKGSTDYRRGYRQATTRDDSSPVAASAGGPADSSEQHTDDWWLGFLAGTFDLAGRCSSDALRIIVADDERLHQVTAALDRFGFDFVREDHNLPGRPRQLRLTGGLRERLRFLHLAEPASLHGRLVNGVPVPHLTAPRVTAVEPLGLELPLWDITTGTGDFIANGVVSHNCFARNTHTYLDLDAGADFDRKVIVKVNAGELVRRELAAPRWRGAHIAMGTNVDCYQRAEGRYRLMPQIIAALRDFANPFSILTKGTLLLRDLPLLRQAAEVTRVGVSYSVGFVDERLWRAVEPGTPSPRRRLDAVRALTDAGFEVGVLMAPILPGLSDSDESIEATVSAIAAAGASSVTPLALHLRPGAREWYARWLGREFPHLVPRYRELYRSGAYAPQAYQRELTARVRIAARRHGLPRAERGGNRNLPEPPAPPATEQLTLL
ncbi:intein C-terminal splicing region/intein N-terminal splicing region [Micromonospora echinaurantiaca]|uniref:Intein C-terminal splicing region/intein N-terminal splicing region n=1 Tax=Micromonospora echinaurantiaca TaxID=47857 RepID=A0A1C5KCW9_9ACTN|nr:intein-containing Rv2578c family radical SAM protein [Micromonospora echinaurantiaca]SCG80564.1 intein C-terminal splicing region/intein N-terminal splicing region [Micromonospora echinaurantiaca]